jgi:hypothetical protein
VGCVGVGVWGGGWEGRDLSVSVLAAGLVGYQLPAPFRCCSRHAGCNGKFRHRNPAVCAESSWELCRAWASSCVDTMCSLRFKNLQPGAPPPSSPGTAHRLPLGLAQRAAPLLPMVPAPAPRRLLGRLPRPGPPPAGPCCTSTALLLPPTATSPFLRLHVVLGVVWAVMVGVRVLLHGVATMLPLARQAGCSAAAGCCRGGGCCCCCCCCAPAQGWEDGGGAGLP